MVKVYSPAKDTWYPLAAILDTGTMQNWISIHVVNLLELTISKVDSTEYTTFDGATVESTEIAQKVLWCGDGSPMSRETDFRVAHNACFDILFGSHLLFSEDILSFNEHALILTKKKETNGMSGR
jgi:hypothetical protein